MHLRESNVSVYTLILYWASIAASLFLIPISISDMTESLFCAEHSFRWILILSIMSGNVIIKSIEVKLHYHILSIEGTLEHLTQHLFTSRVSHVRHHGLQCVKVRIKPNSRPTKCFCSLSPISTLLDKCSLTSLRIKKNHNKVYPLENDFFSLTQ